MTPHRFQSGFVANRIARFERLRLGDPSIRYVSAHHLIKVKGEARVVKSVAFYIKRDGKDGPEYWVSHNDGFVPCLGLYDAEASKPPPSRQYEGR